MLLSRAQLLDSGVTDRQLRAAVAANRIIRLHRGFYVRAKDWNQLWWEGQHLMKVLAVRAAGPADGPVFSHVSAAVLWGLPIYRMGDKPVQVVVDGSRHTRIVGGVIRRSMQIAESDIVERDGMRLTSLTRTVFDVARMSTFEAAVGCADAALRQTAVSGQILDIDAAETWRADALENAHSGLRGVRQARQVIEFADGRAQFPGESVSRVRLFQLGFSKYDLQVPVVGAYGDQYWLDFAFPGARTFGEFDGHAKYIDPSLRTTESAEEAVLAEKQREDDIRGVTGWRFARWGYDDIRTAHDLGTRLAAFGIRPPG